MSDVTTLSRVKWRSYETLLSYTTQDQHIKELKGQVDEQKKLLQNVIDNNDQIIQGQNKQFQELQDLSKKLSTINEEQSRRIEKLEDQIKMENNEKTKEIKKASKSEISTIFFFWYFCHYFI
ncbi:hypothetical protein M9Y10_007060 [Tritrichomonas musculus]|uniref:Uncharacterized protein n=1 Tax=Tritrichomonas musculus TaxID=1915356 RepID=A0ABR2J0C6_9EUKA